MHPPNYFLSHVPILFCVNFCNRDFEGKFLKSPGSLAALRNLTITEFKQPVTKKIFACTIERKMLAQKEKFDHITALRDYCVQNDHPLPNFKVISAQPGRVLTECTLAHVRTIGFAPTEEEATQRSAARMKECVFEEREPSKKYTSLEEDARNSDRLIDFRFKTYGELMGKKDPELPGVPLKDRHEFFSNYPEDIKKAAWEVIRNPYDYCSAEEQAMELFAALRMFPTISERPMSRGMQMQVIIDCNVPYDVLFIRQKNKIWQDVITYFNEMLE